MPPRTKEVAQQDASTKKEKRKPVRRDPEKRRQQNIQAQRKYREKLRERLDRLEALAASAAQSRGVEIPAAGPGPSVTPVPIGPDVSVPHITASSISSHSTSISSSILSTGTAAEYQPLVPQINDIPLNLASWNPDTYAPLPDDSLAFNIWDPTLFDSSPSALDLWNSTTSGSQSDSSPSEDFFGLPQTSLPGLTPFTTGVFDSVTLTGTSYSTQAQPDKRGPCWTTTINCGCPTPHFQIESQGPRPFKRSTVKVFSLEPSTRTPDPYLNNLRIDQICTITALWEVGNHVGIDEEFLCEENSLSPFYQSSELNDDPTKANIVRAVQGSFKNLKPDMRPTKEQITISHHPYVDIIPCRTLRKNLIIHQGEFDEDEFFHDALTGLVCWGGAGLGKRDRNLSTGHASSGTPWDVRSWEARVWFLKKYWNLLGGEDGELVRQSEWWRNIRGDETDVIEL
ncbi:hypothetical protein BJY04DRAFT_186362 [Aspergillus karnatakaensis]|uniref:bZIP transcription factor n=1 Tax=Aspergillus karnatakaensis TaxID=1810916 RepID=UPI003CCE0727